MVEIIPGEGDGNAGASKPKDEGKEEPPKEEPPKEEPKKEEPPKEQPKQEEPPKKEEKPAAPPPKQESKPAEPKKEASAPAPAEESSTPAFGSREERRVCIISKKISSLNDIGMMLIANMINTGQDVPHASPYR